MKQINLHRPVKIDGIDFEPGIHSVEDGYADSCINAGWASLAKGKPKPAQDDEPVDDDEPVETVGTDDDKPVDVPAPSKKPARKR